MMNRKLKEKREETKMVLYKVIPIPTVFMWKGRLGE
jgi:hypothetical protein